MGQTRDKSDRSFWNDMQRMTPYDFDVYCDSVFRDSDLETKRTEYVLLRIVDDAPVYRMIVVDTVSQRAIDLDLCDAMTKLYETLETQETDLLRRAVLKARALIAEQIADDRRKSQQAARPTRSSRSRRRRDV